MDLTGPQRYDARAPALASSGRSGPVEARVRASGRAARAARMAPPGPGRFGLSRVPGSVLGARRRPALEQASGLGRGPLDVWQFGSAAVVCPAVVCHVVCPAHCLPAE